MRERITVRVTQEHIERGKRGDWECCPVALAIAEVLADEEKGKWYTARREVAIRIMRYDDGGSMEPFRFTLRVHDEKMPSLSRLGVYLSSLSEYHLHDNYVYLPVRVTETKSTQAAIAQ